jgi:hypothetical protein
MVRYRVSFARLSLHTCNYGIFCGWYPYSPFIHKCLGFTLPVSRRRYSNRRDTSASGWRRPRKRSTNSRAAVPATLLQARRVNSMTQYSVTTWSQLSTAEHCVPWVHLTTRFMYRRDNTAEKWVAPFDDMCISKTNRLRTLVVKIARLNYEWITLLGAWARISFLLYI